MSFSFVKANSNFNFVAKRKIAFLISFILILGSIASLVVNGGPRYGIDFAGGMVVQVAMQKDVGLEELRAVTVEIDEVPLSVQEFGLDGSEYLIRTSIKDIDAQEIQKLIDAALTNKYTADGFTIQRVEMVGPKVGADLRTSALEALFYTVLLLAIYISGRFEQRWFVAISMAVALFAGVTVLQLFNIPLSILIFIALAITLLLCWYLKLNYALGAVLALIHDVIITVGIFSVLDKEFDLTIIAALLAIIGYSLNDTIIVFDRIRENLSEHADADKDKAAAEYVLSDEINKSINQTLSRTLLTSATTLITVFFLFFFGGSVIHDFALALMIGIIVGTYSSIFVASSFLAAFGISAPPKPREKVISGEVV